MSVWESHPAHLRGQEGDLINIRVYSEPHELENVLDALAKASFPINPQILHREKGKPSGRKANGRTICIDFPAYSRDVAEIRAILKASGHEQRRMEVHEVMAGVVAS